MEQHNLDTKIAALREMMKAYTALDEDYDSDQEKGLAQPPLEKGSIGTNIIALTKDFSNIIKTNDFLTILNNRTSRRKYSETPMQIDELAFLLWATQGIKHVAAGKVRKATIRTVPSAGARHPFETYLFVKNVNDLAPGLYHYIALEHQLEFVGSMDRLVDRLTEAYAGQEFFGEAAVDFVWTVVPYRSEWRYTTKAQKYALIDVGHVCQNLYLACEAIGCGTCAVGAYDQALADGLLGLDTNPSCNLENEFVVYAAPVGKLD